MSRIWVRPWLLMLAGQLSTAAFITDHMQTDAISWHTYFGGVSGSNFYTCCTPANMIDGNLSNQYTFDSVPTTLFGTFDNSLFVEFSEEKSMKTILVWLESRSSYAPPYEV